VKSKITRRKTVQSRASVPPYLVPELLQALRDLLETGPGALGVFAISECWTATATN
jgi:hypothetical protein